MKAMSSTFMQRFWTTVILLPAVLWLLLAANPWILGLLILGLILWAGIEWLAFIPEQRLIIKILFMLGLLLAIGLSLSFIAFWLGLCVWGLLFISVLTYPSSQAIWGHKVIVALLAYVVLPLALWSSTALYQSSSQGRLLCIYLLCLVCSADIGAYLSGKCWGRHRLIPRVSPGKTWEGALGGVLFSLAVSLLAYFYFRPVSLILWLGLALLTAIITMFGDLVMSMLKRRVQLKDTGNVFPGHGGLLDRVDGLLAAIPIFYAMQSYFQAGM